MRNFKVTLDLSSCYVYVKKFKLREFDAPFLTLFVQAEDPDEVCYEIVERLINQILREDNTITTRIICRKIKKLIRFDRIKTL